MPKYLIIGNGAAGTTAADNIRKNDSAGSITIVSDESLPYYSRPRLCEFISGKVNEEKIVIKKEKWYQDQNIELMLNTRITTGEPESKTVTTQDGKKITYDKLLIAVGSHAFIPPIKGVEKTGVFSIRSIEDVIKFLEYATPGCEVVIIGGGLIGLEIGNELICAGRKVTIVEAFPRLLPNQVDDAGSQILSRILEDVGFSFKLNAKTKEIAGNDCVESVLLESSELLPAKMVLISAGVRSNLELAQNLGLNCNRGIVVDESLTTSQQDIYAAGDVAEFNATSYGIWAAAMAQGKIAGANMAGGSMTYGGTTPANTLKIAGVDLASAGNIDAENKLEAKVFADEKIYKKIVISNNTIVGCIMLGDKKGFNKVVKAISEKTNISEIDPEVWMPDTDNK